MYELVVDYLPQISLGTVVTIFTFVINRTRNINDKNLIDVFKGVKDTAIENQLNVSRFQDGLVNLERNVEKIQNDVMDEVENINKTVLAFTESELYTKMLKGLEQVDDLLAILEQKDAVITRLNSEIKNINMNLEKLVNERKL